MKRVLFVSVIAALAVLGAGCSDDSGSETGTTTSKATTTTSATATTTTGSAEHAPGYGDPGHQPPATTPPGMMPNPNGDGTWVPCEGTICTNPNHGAGPDGGGETAPPPVETTSPAPPSGPGDIVNPTTTLPPTGPGGIVQPTQ